MSITLREARRQRGKTLFEVAQAVGTDTGNLSRIETGQQRPGDDLALKLYEYYGGEVNWPEILIRRKSLQPSSTSPSPNRRQVPTRRSTERRQEPTRRAEEATPGRRTGGERRQGERRAAKAAEDPPKPKPALSSDEACPEPRRRGKADRAA